MPNEVIKRVEQLGRTDNRPEFLVFTDLHRKEMPDVGKWGQTSERYQTYDS